MNIDVIPWISLMSQRLEDRLKKALAIQGILRWDQIQIVAEEQAQTGEPFEAACLRLGLVEGAVLKRLLAELTGLPYTDLEVEVDISIAQELLSLEEAQRFLVFAHHGEVFDVALEDPWNVAQRDFIQKALERRSEGNTHCRFFYTDAKALEAALRRFKTPRYEAVLEEAPSPYRTSASDLTSSPDVASLLEDLLQQAVSENVSDIHLEPLPFRLRVRFRQDGLLYVHQEFHLRFWGHLVIRLKILANLDIAEARRPQSGHFTQEVCGQKCDFRVSTHPTIHGENIVIRILYRHRDLLSLEELGFDSKTIETLLHYIKQPYGLILLCGPTGSGKTTTLYTLCSKMDALTQNIMTLEEPVEYQFEAIRQTEIQHADVLSFADGVRSILRQDPDVLFIGEIRDEETAQMALRAAMTGHLVLATIHANDALRAPARLFDLGIRPALLSGQLLMVMAQRLVRKICSVCQGKGGACETCRGMGFKGRLAISEILEVTAEVDACLTQAASLAELETCARSNGYLPLFEDGLAKVRANLTTMEELQRVCGQGKEGGRKS